MSKIVNYYVVLSLQQPRLCSWKERRLKIHSSAFTVALKRSEVMLNASAKRHYQRKWVIVKRFLNEHPNKQEDLERGLPLVQDVSRLFS